jgi:tetratricopeptide (TPR) repeat protein
VNSGDDMPKTAETPARTPPAPRTGWWWLALALTALMATVLVVAVTVSVNVTMTAKAKAADPPFTPVQRADYDGVGENNPLDPNVPRDAAEDEANVRAYFARFAEALRDPDGLPDDLFDWAELLAAVPEDAVEPPVQPDGTPQESKFYARGVIRIEMAVWKTWDWKKTDVRKVMRRPDGEAIEAVVVHRTADGKFAKRRWTFSDSFDGLRVLGWEDLHTGLTARDRTYARATAGLSPSVRKHRHWRYEQLADVHRLIDAKQWADAEERLDQLRVVRFDGDLQCAVDLAEARLALGYRLFDDGDWDEELATEILEDLVSRHPHRLAAYPLLAETHLTAGDYLRAIEVCDAALGVTGDDADLLAVRGAARSALLENDDAEADFAAALALDPFQPRAVNHRRQQAAPADKKKVADLLATAPDATTLFDSLVQSAIVDADWDGVIALAERYRGLRPKEVRWVSPLVTAYLTIDRVADAEAVFKAGLKVSPPSERAAVVERFVWAMIGHNKQDRVYAAVPSADAPVAFRLLAESYEASRLRWVKTPDPATKGQREKATNDLTDLIALHRKTHPDDTRLALHDGRLKLDRGQFKEAAGVLATAYAKLTYTGDPSQDHQSGAASILRELVLAKYKSGQAVECFREVKPAAVVFDQLMDSIITDADAATLSKLLDARQAAGGDTPHELYYRAEADRLANRHAAAAAKYADYLKGETDDDKGFHWAARANRIRCLVRAGDTAAAGREVKANAATGVAVELRALVLVKEGKTADAEKLLRETLATRPIANWLYADADLGPILKADADFAAFRKDFPPPR